MRRLEVSGAVRLIYRSLGVKGLNPPPLRSDQYIRGMADFFLTSLYNVLITRPFGARFFFVSHVKKGGKAHNLGSIDIFFYYLIVSYIGAYM